MKEGFWGGAGGRGGWAWWGLGRSEEEEKEEIVEEEEAEEVVDEEVQDAERAGAAPALRRCCGSPSTLRALQLTAAGMLSSTS